MNLAVGFFDGVHLGHRRILAQADAALTFRAHPATVFAPARAPALLMTCNTRLATLAAVLAKSPSAPGAVRALEFTPELSAQPPEDFADWLRATYPELETVLCGANWTFGAGGAGTADFLRARGFRVEVVPYVERSGGPVSSTRVRAAVHAGELELAAEMLGCPWAMEGVVARGKGLGRKLGFPTLNLLPAAGLVRPPHGVYAVATPWGPGIANYGVAPTMGDRAWTEAVLEVNVFADAVEAPVGASLLVEMKRFIRPERRFASLDELQAQIARDVAACR
ncbi:MAG: bifunctional riboflavin kinase/FMN adenylyltransferase [Kiritimatiellia bacterium]